MRIHSHAIPAPEIPGILCAHGLHIGPRAATDPEIPAAGRCACCSDPYGPFLSPDGSWDAWICESCGPDALTLDDLERAEADRLARVADDAPMFGTLGGSISETEHARMLWPTERGDEVAEACERERAACEAAETERADARFAAALSRYMDGLEPADIHADAIARDHAAAMRRAADVSTRPMTMAERAEFAAWDAAAKRRAMFVRG